VIYSTATVCSAFQLPRSTLFWWEGTGLIPQARRGVKRNRRYGPEHLLAIRKLLVDKAKKSEADSRIEALEPIHASYLLDRPEEGQTLLEHDVMSPRRLGEATFRFVLAFAQRLGPEDPLRGGLLKVLAESEANATRSDPDQLRVFREWLEEDERPRRALESLASSGAFAA